MEFKDITITPEVEAHVNKNSPKFIKVVISVSKNHTSDEVFGDVGNLPGEKHGPVDKTDHYVFASLTPDQIRELGKNNKVRKIWLNRDLSEEMVMDSSRTINGYGEEQFSDNCCEDITWAVLDDGVEARHEALITSNVVDCDFTEEGPVGGHGTHVAGIIAGYFPDKPFYGVAPKCQLYNYKVIGKKHRDISLVIRALEDIRKLNGKKGKLVIHGANLSLKTNKMPYDKEFQPGHNPICEEANRLVESGVVVCVAAGNTGSQAFEIPSKNGTDIWAGYVPMSIADPGAAELVITVGSTHKSRPDKYGVSNFSARGPTGDGRLKPDVVAPGEKILSAVPENKFLALTGTSQSTAFVSGVAAQLLRTYPALIGKPKEVKKIIVKSCRDLNRDRSCQGHGLVDMTRALSIASDPNSY